MTPGMTPGFTRWFESGKPLVGMVHLKPLPGSPRYDGDFQGVVDAAVQDAMAIAAGGAQAVMVENFGDVPFFKEAVPRETVAAMAAVVTQVSRAVELPVGVNVLRNDAEAAMAVAATLPGEAFIRVNVLCGARVTDQGLIEGRAAQVLRLRTQLHARRVAVFADVDVKHSAALAHRPLEQEVWDTLRRGLADALIVSGLGTGEATSPDHLRRVKDAAGDTPVFVGSGVTLESIPELASIADGFIVGTAIKAGGRVDQPVSQQRVSELSCFFRGSFRG